MNSWKPGDQDRRKPDSRLDTIETLLRDFIKENRLMLLGDGDKPGIAGKVSKFTDEFQAHLVSDRWMFGAGLTLLVLILGKLIVH